MSRQSNHARSFIAAEDGATVVEYGVLIALIIAASVTIIITLGKQINDGFAKFSESLTGVGMSPPGSGS